MLLFFFFPTEKKKKADFLLLCFFFPFSKGDAAQRWSESSPDTLVLGKKKKKNLCYN